MPIKFDIVPGETEHITFRGVTRRNPTLLMRVRTPIKTFSLSRKALLLGVTLILCQIVDGLLTYTGLLLVGVEMEGNGLLREMIYAYGLVPGLCMAKVGALVTVALITVAAHRRKWIRPIILALSAVYVTLALVPWTLVLWYRL